MEPTSPDIDKRDVRRPMNAFLIFCKRHRSIVREKNPDLDNRSVTRILGDLWANLKEEEKSVYTNLAKQYKDAFMKANPDYKWHNPEKAGPGQKPGMGKPTNMKVLKNEMDILHEGSIMPGKLADPSNMGGLSLLLMAGQHKIEADNQHSLVSIPGSSSSVDNANSSILLDTLTSKGSGSPPSKPSILPHVVHKMDTGTSEQTETGAITITTVDNCNRRTAITAEPVWTIDGKLVENQTKKDPGGIGSLERMIPPQNHLALLNAGTSSPHSVVDKSEVGVIPTSKVKPVSPLQSFMVAGLGSKPLLSQAMAAPRLPHKSLLTGTILESINKGGYSDILRDNSAGTKLTYNLDNQVKAEVMLDKPLDNHPPDEKENISKILMTDVKECKDDIKEDSIVQCEKIVVNEIIDKLYSSESSGKKSLVKDSEVAFHEAINAAITDKYEVSRDNVRKYGHDCVSEKSRSKSGEDIYDEPDGNQHVDDGNTVSQDCDGQKEADTSRKSEDLEDFKPREELKRVRTWSNVSKDSDTHEGDDDAEELHPVRKSRRRNRGQRYQELINEGIIQPSKERMAALHQHPALEDGLEEEDFQTIDSYILPETAIRRIRKRTTSESAKDKMIHMDDAKRYKTGDFDLEAQIATLPACSVENMGRKRGFVRQRHNSECMYMRKHSEDQHPVTPVFDIERTLTMPPHMKLPSPEIASGPVVGSRKRKARKHSITHLLPAPPGIFNNTAKCKNNQQSVDESNGEENKATGYTDEKPIPNEAEEPDCQATKHSEQKAEAKSEVQDVVAAHTQSVAMVDNNDNSVKVSDNRAVEPEQVVDKVAGGDSVMLHCDNTDPKNGATVDLKGDVSVTELIAKTGSLVNSGIEMYKQEPVTGSLVKPGINEVPGKHKQEPGITEELLGTRQSVVKSDTGEMGPSMSLSCRRLSGVGVEQQQDLTGTVGDSSIHV